MNDQLFQVSVGGAVALLILREVFQFLKGRRNGAPQPATTAGGLSSEFWQAEQRRAISDVLAATVLPILANQTKILSDLKDAEQSTALQLVRLVTTIDLQRKN